jgi:hypothetical protein
VPAYARHVDSQISEHNTNHTGRAGLSRRLASSLDESVGSWLQRLPPKLRHEICQYQELTLFSTIFYFPIFSSIFFRRLM